jgi:chromosome segregation ATPase
MAKGATRVVSTVLRLEGEDQYTAALRKAGSEVGRYDKEIKKLDTQFADQRNTLEVLTKRTDLLSDQYEAQKNAVVTLNEAKNQAILKERDIQVGIENNARLIKNFIALQQQYGNSFDVEGQKITDANKAIKELQRDMEISIEQHQKAENAVNKWSAAFANAEAKLNSIRAEGLLNQQYMEEAAASTDKCASSINKYGQLTYKNTVLTQENAYITRAAAEGASRLGNAFGYNTSVLNEAANSVFWYMQSIRMSKQAIDDETAALVRRNAALTLGISLAISVASAIISYVRSSKDASDETQTLAEQVEALAKSYKEALKSIESTKQAGMAELELTDDLIDRYEALNAKQSLNSTEQTELANVVGTLQRVYKDLDWQLDSTTGKWNVQIDTLRRTREEMRRQIEMQALYDQALEAQKNVLIARQIIEEEYGKTVEDFLDNYHKKYADELSKTSLEDRLLYGAPITLPRQMMSGKLKDMYDIAMSLYRAEERVKNFYTEVENGSKTTGDALDALGKSAEDTEVSIDSYTESLSNLKGALSDAAGALREMGENGEISLDTMLSLLETDAAYAGALEIKNGKIRLNAAALKEIALAQLEAARAEIEAAKSTAQVTLEQEEDKQNAILETLRLHNEAAKSMLFGLQHTAPLEERIKTEQLTALEEQIRKTDAAIAEAEGKIQGARDQVGAYDLQLEALDGIYKQIEQSGVAAFDAPRKAAEEAGKQAEENVRQLDTLGNAVVTALKEKYKEAQDAESAALKQSIENVKRWEEEQVSAIQSEIDALDRLEQKEQDEARAAELKEKADALQYKLRFETDAYNRAELEKQYNAAVQEYEDELAAQRKEAYKESLRAQIEAVKEQAEGKREGLETQLQEIEDAYARLTETAALEAEAHRLIVENGQEEIIELLRRYNAEYFKLGQSMGELMAAGLSDAYIESLLGSIQKSAAHYESALRRAAQYEYEAGKKAVSNASAQARVATVQIENLTITSPSLTDTAGKKKAANDIMRYLADALAN